MKHFLALFILSGLIVARAVEIQGTLSMPDEWIVFPDISDDLDAEVLQEIPQSITMRGMKVTGQKISVENNVADLKNIFGKIQLGNTAYVFIPLNSLKNEK